MSFNYKLGLMLNKVVTLKPISPIQQNKCRDRWMIWTAKTFSQLCSYIPDWPFFESARQRMKTVSEQK